MSRPKRQLYLSPFVCPRPVKVFFGLIPTPFICATHCRVSKPFEEIECPTCGLKRPYPQKGRLAGA